MEASVAQQKHSGTVKHFWSIYQILIASFIAGPVAGCYLLGRNYRELGHPKQSRKCYLVGFVGTFLFLHLLILMPQELFEKMPMTLIPLSLAGLIANFANIYQKKQIDERISQGCKYFSSWGCLLLILVLLFVQIIFIIIYTWHFYNLFMILIYGGHYEY